MNKVEGGVFPTMITPFRRDLTIDYNALEQLIKWYLEEGIDGVFAVAQSSAMFELSLKERVELAGKVREFLPDDLPVVASGHVSDTLEYQAEELNMIAQTGVDIIVLLTNRFAAPGEPDSLWIDNLEKLIELLPKDIPLGLYECPFPYKRVLSKRIFSYLVKNDRFSFIKDTCCDPALIRERGTSASGSSLKLFNANAPTLLFSLENGYAGYSGIMTNFHSKLYYWLCCNWENEPEKAKQLQEYLSVSSMIENYGYPMNAKYALKQKGIPIETVCRRSDMRYSEFTEYDRFVVDQFMELSDTVAKEIIK